MLSLCNPIMQDCRLWRSISETVIENVLVYSCCKPPEKRLPASEIKSRFENFRKKIKAKWISLLRSDRAKSAGFGRRTRPLS